MDLVLSPLLVGDVDKRGAAEGRHQQDGDGGEDHEDDEGGLTQLDQEKDVILIACRNNRDRGENFPLRLTSVKEQGGVRGEQKARAAIAVICVGRPVVSLPEEDP